MSGTRPARKVNQLPFGRPWIAPSLLAARYDTLATEVAAVEKGGAEALHLDIMDGHFVPNLSFGADLVKALRPGTPASAILPYLEEVEMVLVMTVEPGFGGQSFREDQLPKIREFRKAIDALGKPIRLEVDGGVGAATAALCREAGADVLVAGSSVFRCPDGDYRRAIEALR